MVSFTTKGFKDNYGLEYAITRKSPNTYVLVYTVGHGMADSREVAILNFSTLIPSRSSPVLPLFASGRPLLWIDTDIDRMSSDASDHEGQFLKGLLAAKPPIVRATGRVRGMHMPQGGLRNAVEVELLLTEDQLAQNCWYCNAIEDKFDFSSHTISDRMTPCGGEGYATTYMCSECQKRSGLVRALMSINRTLLG